MLKCTGLLILNFVDINSVCKKVYTMSYHDNSGIEDVDAFQSFTSNESQIWLEPSELPHNVTVSGLPFSLTQPSNDANYGDSIGFVIESPTMTPVCSPNSMPGVCMSP